LLEEFVLLLGFSLVKPRVTFYQLFFSTKYAARYLRLQALYYI